MAAMTQSRALMGQTLSIARRVAGRRVRNKMKI